jgi:hypothetical protein
MLQWVDFLPNNKTITLPFIPLLPAQNDWSKHEERRVENIVITLYAKLGFHEIALMNVCCYSNNNNNVNRNNDLNDTK